MAEKMHGRTRGWEDARYGPTSGGGGLWQRIKDGVREAWNAVTGQTGGTYKHHGDREVPTTDIGPEGKRI